ncbi:hypothetical protein HD554DRAFT_2128777 [Boletus coccyginus]|nr:hypothetical protein HD554DRAFT_2128777 [Boletus coccyginus]
MGLSQICWQAWKRRKDMSLMGSGLVGKARRRGRRQRWRCSRELKRLHPTRKDGEWRKYSDQRRHLRPLDPVPRVLILREEWRYIWRRKHSDDTPTLPRVMAHNTGIWHYGATSQRAPTKNASYLTPSRSLWRSGRWPTRSVRIPICRLIRLPLNRRQDHKRPLRYRHADDTLRGPALQLPIFTQIMLFIALYHSTFRRDQLITGKQANS